jgi:hypothetical protein
MWSLAVISFSTTPPHARIAPADGGPADPDFFRRRSRLAEQRLTIRRAGALRHWVWHLDHGPIARRRAGRYSDHHGGVTRQRDRQSARG